MLEPRLRTPIKIQLAGDLSLKEIADTLKISVAAVKVIVALSGARA
jgi:DNA-directed RNA polymerase specialized sigma24 family protein